MTDFIYYFQGPGGNFSGVFDKTTLAVAPCCTFLELPQLKITDKITSHSTHDSYDFLLRAHKQGIKHLSVIMGFNNRIESFQTMTLFVDQLLEIAKNNNNVLADAIEQIKIKMRILPDAPKRHEGGSR